LLSVSSLTLVISILIIVGYLWSISHANRMSDTLGTATTVIEMIAHLAIWIGTAVAYRVARTGNDLWGWSCSDAADKIQSVFQEVDFGANCDSQTNSWYASIAQGVLAIVVAVSWFLAWKRVDHKEKIVKRETMRLGVVR
jgi:hypothetical protein